MMMMVMPIILLLYTSLQRESWIWRNFPIFCAVCIWSHNSMSWFLVFKTFLFRDQRNNFVQVIDNLIETGHGEQIFQRAIQEQGRGHVCTLFCFYSLYIFSGFKSLYHPITCGACEACSLLQLCGKKFMNY
jgi:uncharacterized membrane protein